jgi:hypothetical protein
LQAIVKLVTGAFAALQIDPSIGRAEALRRAEMAMLSRQPAEILSSLVLGTPRRLGTRRCPWIALDGIGRLGAVAALLADVQKRSARLHLTAVMMIHHRTAIVQWGDTTERDRPPIRSDPRQFGRNIVTLWPEHDLETQRRTADEDCRYRIPRRRGDLPRLSCL